jgi:hypothetical protein
MLFLLVCFCPGLPCLAMASQKAVGQRGARLSLRGARQPAVATRRLHNHRVIVSSGLLTFAKTPKPIIANDSPWKASPLPGGGWRAGSVAGEVPGGSWKWPDPPLTGWSRVRLLQTCCGCH